jgi:ubiquinone/menaquinone biosynthesis C-methylase UbiE
MTLLNCLKCKNRLDVYTERCACPKCGMEWPITGGIPRFFQAPTYYWGEVNRNAAGELLEAARKGSWVDAVRSRFPEGDNMIFGLLDLQRASWIPMLGLDERSVALDVGSGYGAITHSISRSVGEVYSVEAIPERIEFTKERLRQEGIQNVRLVQASATALPLVENTFDLVVTNGVLEWVGEWDLEGDPRSTQLRFLGTLWRLLKDDGVLVIGIENRIGYGLFLGNDDHSGIPYTSLVPRRLASFMLRHSSTSHHRTQLNPKKEYRTYTYSERGYRRLLADAGFVDVSCHWADPGYNQPYHLIPLAMPQWVQEQFLDILDHPAPSPRRSWRRQLKRILARSRFLPLVLPDFVLIASKRPGRKTKIQSWLEEELGSDRMLDDGAADPRAITWALHTHPFAKKSIVRLGKPRGGQEVAFIKVQMGSREGVDQPEAEVINLVKVREALQQSDIRSISVPQTLAEMRVGNTSYWLESAAQGVKLARLVRRTDYFRDMRNVKNDFTGIVARAVELTTALQNIRSANTIDARWLEISEDLKNPEMRAAIEAARYFGASGANSHPGWVQHGDLSIENIFFDQQNGRVELFDWVDLAGGFPPLYDLFSLFYSTGYLAPGDEVIRFPNEEERWIASFKAVFLTDTRFARIARDLILRACEQLKVQANLIPSLLMEFLLIRTHYFRPKSAVQRRVHLRLLQVCVEKNHMLFGRFPLLNSSAVSSAE